MTDDLPDVPFDSPVTAPPVKPHVNGVHESFETAQPVSREEVMNHAAQGPTDRRDERRAPAPAVDVGPARAARALPHSLEAEAGLLGSIFIDPEKTLRLCEKERITTATFYDTQNAAIMRAIFSLHARQQPIEVAVVAEELKTYPEMQGTNVYLKVVSVSESTATTAQSTYFAAKLREHEIRRELIRSTLQTVEDAYDLALPITEVSEAVRRRLDFALTGPRGRELWPDPVSAHNLCTNKPVTPPVLIDGILYTGGTMLLSGPSKSRKTFSALDAGISIATGMPWMGFRTIPSDVLYLNLELQDFATEDRISLICKARGIPPPTNFHCWNLRGRQITLEQLSLRLPEMIRRTRAKVVCIDPHYKVSAVSDMEENSNDAQGKLLISMENLTLPNGASLILTHHFAKGDASAKNAIDRASGGGVFARWGDVMLTFTPHEEEDAMTVEMSLRNFAPVRPFVVRWEYPRWVRDGELDPAKLKSSRGPKEKNTAEDALRALGSEILTYAEWEKRSRMTPTTFKRKRQELLDDGRVEKCGLTYRKSVA